MTSVSLTWVHPTTDDDHRLVLVFLLFLFFIVGNGYQRDFESAQTVAQLVHVEARMGAERIQKRQQLRVNEWDSIAELDLLVCISESILKFQ